MTNTIAISTRRSSPFLTSAPVWRVGAAASLAAALVLLGYGAVADALSVPMRAGEPWAHQAQPINAGSFATGTLFCAFWGILLAVALARWAARPARVFARTATALVLVSLALPLAASDTPAATRLTLAGAHLAAAAIIVPAVTRRLAHRAPAARTPAARPAEREIPGRPGLGAVIPGLK